MLTTDEVLRPLLARRADAVVVTTMSVVRPWGRLGNHSLDFASADSAMGHAADLALGVALARPERRVICLNGDGSMLMTLGTLATIVEAAPPNLVLFVIDNGGYEITGHQAVPASGRLDWAGLARAAGISRSYDFDARQAYEQALDEILSGPGPTFVRVAVAPGSEGPIGRSPTEEADYLRVSLFDSARTVRRALLEGDEREAPTGPAPRGP